MKNTAAKFDPGLAYEGVEAMERFDSAAALDGYRAMVIDKSRHQADFILQHVPDARSMVEACCGNGRLLVALAPHMDEGAGFDIAQSRVEFAKQWTHDLGLTQVQVWRDDVLAPSERLRALRADLVVCITGAFNYFDAIEQGHDKTVAALFHHMIEPGGALLLELYQHPEVIAHCELETDGVYRRWAPLPDGDPFRFSLSTFRFDNAERVLFHEKTFIGRDGTVDEGRGEALRTYDGGEVKSLLADGFDDVRLFADWDGSPYRDGAERMVVLARRP